MKFVCVGHSTYDTTLPMDEYPTENIKYRLEGHIECGGGPAANGAYLLAKWGMNTAIASVIGNDFYGDQIIKEYEKVGCDTSLLEKHEDHYTTSSYIIANRSNGSRTILSSKDKPIRKLNRELNIDCDVILIDGRFRVRVTKNSNSSKCKLSWKRRIKSTLDTNVNKEEEVELSIKYEEYDNFIFILENVLKMRKVESYERYRTIFTNDDIEISVDEYPFGIALEIENKSDSKNPEDVVRNWVELLGFDINDAYRLSWDDKYSELCKEQGIEHYNFVTFDKPMPKVLD